MYILYICIAVYPNFIEYLACVSFLLVMNHNHPSMNDNCSSDGRSHLRSDRDAEPMGHLPDIYSFADHSETPCMNSTYIYIILYIYIDIDIHIHIHTHTYIHTYITLHYITLHY